jgi:hypothetical protein
MQRKRGLMKTAAGLIRPGWVAALLLLTVLNAQGAAFDQSLYQEFLDRYVVQDRTIKDFTLNVVDYAGIYKAREDPGSLYRRILDQLAAFDPGSLQTREEKTAFWINAYNIGAVKMIIDHYPVDSIRSSKINWLKNPWNKKVLTVGGKEYSLGKIEHEILLGELREPMAHFAVVCASLSCPEIAPRAFTGNEVTGQMEAQARRYLKDEKKGLKIDRDKGEVYFSKIFKFDKKTFPQGGKSAAPLIGPFIEPADREYLDSGDYRVKYLDYDWSLNSLSSAHE